MHTADVEYTEKHGVEHLVGPEGNVENNVEHVDCPVGVVVNNVVNIVDMECSASGSKDDRVACGEHVNVVLRAGAHGCTDHDGPRAY